MFLTVDQAEWQIKARQWTHFADKFALLAIESIDGKSSVEMIHQLRGRAKVHLFCRAIIVHLDNPSPGLILRKGTNRGEVASAYKINNESVNYFDYPPMFYLTELSEQIIFR